MEKNWKNSLLKSGLPLEHLVSELLGNLNIFVSGEYSYIRKNETGNESEFSIDLSSFELFGKKNKEWASINYLIECKYSSPGIIWLFAPLTNPEIGISEIINVNQDLTTSTVSLNPLYKWESQFLFCVKGIEIQKNNYNPNIISHGLNQIRYGIPQHISRGVSTQAHTYYDDDLRIEFTCPILLTTADLRVLKSGLSLNDFYESSDIDKISYKVDILVHTKPVSTHLYNYVNEIIENLFNKNPEIINRLKALSNFKDEERKRTFQLSPDWDVRFNIHSSVENIFIVSFGYLETLINDIRESVTNCGKSKKQFAKLKFDRRNFKLEVNKY